MNETPDNPSAPPEEAAPSTEQVPPFAPRTLESQLRWDAALRGLAVAGVVVVLAAVMVLEPGGSAVALAGMVLVVAGWLAVNVVSAKVSRELPRVAAMIEADPVAAEARLAEHMRRRPLMRWVRLMLYHRLAGLRHRQRRFAESAAICAAVLRHRLGPARQARAHLLLMLTEAALECGDLHAAYGALSELFRTRLTLLEALQRLALQTRYEVMAGHPAAAVQQAQRKAHLAELMPTPQCGALHAMLATAAVQAKQHDLATWLWGRAQLLCTPEQLEELGVAEMRVDGA